MDNPHELRTYDYVNRPYELVTRALQADLRGILGRATQGAASRAGALAAHLKVDLGGVVVGTDVTVDVSEVVEMPSGARQRLPTTRISLKWKATKATALFPSMRAELAIYPLSPEETQLELHGSYAPPFGVIGGAVDRLVLHRVADASVHRFVAELAKYLRSALPQP